MSEDAPPCGDGRRIIVPQISLDVIVGLQRAKASASAVRATIRTQYESKAWEHFCGSGAVTERTMSRWGWLPRARYDFIDLDGKEKLHKEIGGKLLEQIALQNKKAISDITSVMLGSQKLYSAFGKVADAIDALFGYFPEIVDDLNLRMNPGIPLDAYLAYRKELRLRSTLEAMEHDLRRRGSREDVRKRISGFLSREEKLSNELKATAREELDEFGKRRPILPIDKFWDNKVIYQLAGWVYEAVIAYNGAVAKLTPRLQPFEGIKVETEPRLKADVENINRHLTNLNFGDNHYTGNLGDNRYNEDAMGYAHTLKRAAKSILGELKPLSDSMEGLVNLSGLSWGSYELIQFAKGQGFYVKKARKKGYDIRMPMYARKLVTKK